MVNIAINMHNFSKRNETCENTTSLPSVSETSSTSSLSDDELDFEKQLDMQAKRQRFEKKFQINQIWMLLLENALKKH